MPKKSQKIRFFRNHIPAFACVAGCHDCCGPVTASSEEAARLPEKSEQEHEAALETLSCPYLGANGCQVYAERPLICRLFGTTPRLPCPQEKRPAEWIDAELEREIQLFMAVTRQVLI